MGENQQSGGLPDPSIQQLEEQYRALRPQLDRFLVKVTRLISDAFQPHKNILAVSVQSRVKEWDSIVEKLERKPRSLKSITDLNDLIGIRVIVLFRTDINVARDIIMNTLEVTDVDDKHKKLEQTQFGYVSLHFAVAFGREWLSVYNLPEYAEMGICAEVQLRTLAEHHWAEAEHALQYKQVEYLPPSLRRDLTRLAALLEAIDLEFERIVELKQSYQKQVTKGRKLSVDSLAAILDQVFPAKNKIPAEPYASLLEDLKHFGYMKPNQFQDLMRKHRGHVIALDNESARNIVDAIAHDQGVETLFDLEEERRARGGSYFSHVGLARAALRRELGDQWDFYWGEKRDTGDPR